MAITYGAQGSSRWNMYQSNQSYSDFFISAPTPGTPEIFPVIKTWNPWTTLHKAFHKFNVDEKAIIEAITKINNEQRQKVADVYKGCYGEDVDDRIDKIRGEDFRHGVKALMRRPSEYAAHELRKAMKGPGTDEEVLIEILCTKTNASIEAIKADYEKVRNHDFFQNSSGLSDF